MKSHRRAFRAETIGTGRLRFGVCKGGGGGCGVGNEGF